MVEKLFGSKTRYKLLELFMSNPNRTFYVREITRAVGEQINSVRRELSNLLSMGIIISDNTNKHLYYEVNQKHEKYSALVGLMRNPGSVAAPTSDSPKTKGLKSAVASASVDIDGAPEASRLGPDEQALGNVSLVVLSGAFTRDQSAPGDVLIVGNITNASLEAYINKLESSVDREISYTCMTDQEFSYRRVINDKFTSQMLGSKLSVRVDRDNITNQAPEFPPQPIPAKTAIRRRGRPAKSTIRATVSPGSKKSSSTSATKPRVGRPPKSSATTQKKRGPGRPPKSSTTVKKRGPGRPPKSSTTVKKRGPGRPPKAKVGRPAQTRVGSPSKISATTQKKRGPGRPPKSSTTVKKRGPGRPPKAK